jgi:ribosomal protein L11 methyltransferase
VWERAWLSRFGPMKFGRRLWVIPGDAEVPVDDAIVVRLDPGLAFGTGTHETTALCLEWLESIDVAGRSVFDFGCGSGILSVAALKLGAAEVEAVDIDLQAVTATRQNAERNFVDERLQVGDAIELHSRQFDIVVANILARTLIDKADLICSLLRPGGELALSGILASQADEVQEAYSGLVGFGPVAMRNDWVRLSGTRSTD